jgi:hypothetical protein
MGEEHAVKASSIPRVMHGLGQGGGKESPETRLAGEAEQVKKDDIHVITQG